MPYYADPAWQSRMAVRLDYNYMLDRLVGETHGLRVDEIEGMREPLARVHAQIRSRSGAGSDFLGFLDLPYQGEEGLAAIEETADRLAALGDVHVVLGIGGSYLGARAILEALLSPFRNELSRADRKGRPRVYFEGNNLDADALGALLDLLPAGPVDDLARRFTLNVISKSGGTIETAVAFRMLRQRAEAVYGEEAARHIVATTDASKGGLKKLADARGYATFVIPDDVGGRYSVLTPVGLLPAAVAGADIRALVAGARFMAERCKEADPFRNPAYMYAALMDLSYRRGRNIAVTAAWAKGLEFVGFWYDQLAAESLGKAEGGRVPLTTVNSRDLHARGQQIQEGAHNTVVTNLFTERFGRTLRVERDPEDMDGLNYLAGWDLSAMQKGAMDGTRFAYAKAGRPSVNVLVPEVNAFTLGQIFYFFELATLAEGYLQGINPLDQPGVEEYKKFMFANLGREDMVAQKAEFDARPQALQERVL